MLEFAGLAVVAPGDVEVGVPESGPAEFLFDLGEDPGKFIIGVEPPLPRVEVREIQAGLEAIDLPAEDEDLLQAPELRPFSHGLDP